MQYDLVIKRTLREAQGILWANLPPASNLPDAQAVKSLRALVRAPQVHQALERGNDTALCFVLRAVNCILSDEDQDHSLPRCRDPHFPLHTFDLFPTNDADQSRN